MQTRGRPVVVLSIDMERHTRIHSYPYQCLESDPTRKSFLDLPQTSANCQLTLVHVWWLSVWSSVESVPYPTSLEPVVWESIMLSAHPQLLPTTLCRNSPTDVSMVKHHRSCSKTYHHTLNHWSQMLLWKKTKVFTLKISPKGVKDQLNFLWPTFIPNIA